MANPYFNAAYYLAHNQDLVIAGYTEANAEEHYNEYGASEGRAPNSYFDAEAYLLANPDLIAGGVTKATALQHFADYGVYEGRIFNNNPALDPANFPASEYAELNEDVAEAFGIEDPADLTPEQAAQLLSHYLIYGVAEKREGAGEFGEAVTSGDTIQVHPTDHNGAQNYVNVGTSGDDVFVWNEPADADEANVNGLAGNDTLKVVNAVGSATLNVTSVETIEIEGGVVLNVNGNGVETLKIDTDGDAVQYSGKNVGAVSVKGDGAVTLNLTGVAGSADVLNLSVGDAASVTTAGFEQVDIALDSKATGVAYIASNKVSGDSLVFNLSGGKADEDISVGEFASAGSGKLETVTVDATGLAGDFLVDADDFGDLAGLVDLVLNTGAGDDEIDLSTGFEGQEVTVNAGAGDDIITASLGIDTITGGAGEDTFNFDLDTATFVIDTDEDGDEFIAAVDVITDFKAADAGIVFTDLVAAEGADLGDIVDDEDDVVGGVITSFATGFLAGKSLLDVVAELDAVLDADTGVLFNFEGSAYLFVSGDAAGDNLGDDDGLIQLTGVNATLLGIVGDTVVFSA